MVKQRIWCAVPWTLAVCAVGLPTRALAAGDFNLSPDFRFVAANLIVFLLLIYPVNKLLIGPFVRLLGERQERSEGAQQRAISIGEEARGLTGQLEGRLAEAREAAQARRAGILAEGREEESRLLGGAREDAVGTIEAMRASVREELGTARATLEDGAAALAREAATRILGRSI
jgi:F-type H+-transporting ATPase subunit b